MIENKLRIKKWSKLLVIVLSVSLSACTTRASSDAKSATERGIITGGLLGGALGAAVTTPVGATLGAAIGGLTGGLIGNYSTKQKTLLQRLEAKQVRIITVGEQINLVIPAELFFLPQSPAMRQQAYPLLNDIAKLLRTYPKTSVTITGYTAERGDSLRNIALSRQRAQVTADYLWLQDLDARLLYTEGKGEREPLADNATSRGRLWNERIEITFQHLPN